MPLFVKCDYLALLNMHPAVVFADNQETVEFSFSDFSCEVQKFIELSRNETIAKIASLENSGLKSMHQLACDYLYTSGMFSTLKVLEEESATAFKPGALAEQKASPEHPLKNYRLFGMMGRISEIEQRIRSSEDDILSRLPGFVFEREHQLRLWCDSPPYEAANSQSCDSEAVDELRARLMHLAETRQYALLLEEIEIKLKGSNALQMLNRNIQARVFVDLIREGKLAEAIALGKTFLVKHEQELFKVMKDGEMSEISFNELAAHLGGRGPLLEETNNFSLKFMLNEAVLQYGRVQTKSQLEQKLWKIEAWNASLRREKIPFDRIRIDQ